MVYFLKISKWFVQEWLLAFQQLFKKILTLVPLCFQEVEVLLENPADVPVYIQILPLALYPNPLAFAEKLLER